MVQKQAQRAPADEVSGPNSTEEASAEALPLMRLAPGERFFKFYILSEPSAKVGQRVEHRIVSKERPDGSLEMVSYNVWTADGHSEKRDVIRVPSLSKALFEQLVARVRAQTDLPPEAFREIDLSRCRSVEEQLHALAGLDL